MKWGEEKGNEKLKREGRKRKIEKKKLLFYFIGKLH